MGAVRIVRGCNEPPAPHPARVPRATLSSEGTVTGRVGEEAREHGRREVIAKAPSQGEGAKARRRSLSRARRAGSARPESQARADFQ